jgi:RNA polymerase sigma factor (sigma-70 family)
MAAGIGAAVVSGPDRIVAPWNDPAYPGYWAKRECDRLVRTYHDRAVTVAARLVPPEDVADALQESYLKVFVALLHGFIPRLEWPWFRRVVINTCHDVREREQRHEREPLEDWMHGTIASDPAVIVEREALCADVRNAVNDLPPPQREILRRTSLEGSPFDSAARVMQIPLSTAKSHARRGRANLARRLTR